MKAILLVIFACAGLQAQAHEFHTPNYCAPTNAALCAHLGYHKQPDVTEAFEFVVDLVAADELIAKVQDVRVELFMPSMGHGSMPVQIEKIDSHHFQVTEAYFLMRGDWTVNIDVVTAEGTSRIEIPFSIK